MSQGSPCSLCKTGAFPLNPFYETNSIVLCKECMRDNQFSLNDLKLDNTPDFFTRFLNEFTLQTFIYWTAKHNVDKLNEWLSHKTGIRNEKNCKVCSRNNDVGVRTCWHCGIDNPV